MENDDRPVGQILSRRDALKLLGVGSAAFLAACASPNQSSTAVPTTASTLGSSPTTSALDCVVRPELTIGPYFVDDQLNRSDIRTEPSDNSVKQGVPLTLAIGVFDVANNSCTPLTDAQVDVWHCDALGVYSGVSDQGFDTTGQQFLRGYQLTDGTGKVQFLTIYPGLVFGQGCTYSLYDPHKGRGWQRLSVHFAIFLRRRTNRRGSCTGTICQQGPTRYAQHIG